MEAFHRSFISIAVIVNVCSSCQRNRMVQLQHRYSEMTYGSRTSSVNMHLKPFEIEVLRTRLVWSRPRPIPTGIHTFRTESEGTESSPYGIPAWERRFACRNTPPFRRWRLLRICSSMSLARGLRPRSFGTCLARLCRWWLWGGCWVGIA
jgi:hypothetical protein